MMACSPGVAFNRSRCPTIRVEDERGFVDLEGRRLGPAAPPVARVAVGPEVLDRGAEPDVQVDQVGVGRLPGLRLEQQVIAHERRERRVPPLSLRHTSLFLPLGHELRQARIEERPCDVGVRDAPVRAGERQSPAVAADVGIGAEVCVGSTVPPVHVWAVVLLCCPLLP